MSPLSFVSADAALVVEVRDIGLLASRRSELGRALAPFVDDRQQAGLVEEIKTTLGFDPTTPAGLKSAGLPISGPMVIAFGRSREHGLYVIPVDDSDRFEDVLRVLLKTTSDPVAIEPSSKDRKATVAYGEFGETRFPLLVWTFRSGYVLIGAGEAEDLVLDAAALLPDKSVLTKPEFSRASEADAAGAARGVGGAGGEDFIIRARAPNGLAEAVGLFARLPSSGNARLPGLPKVPSASLTLSVTQKGLKLASRLRLSEADAAEVTAALTKAPDSTGASKVLGAEEAFVRAEWSVDAAAIARLFGGEDVIRRALSPASPARPASIQKEQRPLEGELRSTEKEQRPKEEEQRPKEEDVPEAATDLALFSGRGAVAVGLRDLSGRDLQEMSRDPASLLWFLMAMDAPDPESAAKLSERMPEISRMVRAPFPLPSDPVREVMDRTILVASDQASLDRAKGLASNDGLLRGASGVAAELRFSVLSASARTFPVRSWPLVARGFAVKAFEVLDALDTLTLEVRPESDGLSAEVTLRLHQGPARKV